MAWLTGYVYHKQITIEGSTAGAQTNYQLKLTVYKGTGTDSAGIVYLNNHCQDDFDDIRFTKSDGSTELDHWRESYVSGTSAIFWIEFDSIPASPDSAVFYIYYSKADATSGSNGKNTFLAFDDFDRANSDSLGPDWTEYGDALWAILNNLLNRPDVTAGRNDFSYHTTLGVVSDIAIRAKIQVTSFSGTDERLGIIVRGNTDATAGHRGYCLLWREEITQLQLLNSQVAWGNSVIKSDHALNDWFWFELVAFGDIQRGKAWKVGTSEPSSFDISQSWTTQASGYIGCFTSDYGVAAGNFDDFFARKYTEPEPTWGTWGTEECFPHSTGFTIG